jgi:hypothetical protein
MLVIEGVGPLDNAQLCRNAGGDVHKNRGTLVVQRGTRSTLRLHYLYRKCARYITKAHQLCELL